jgi:hypothetical protein
MAKSPNSLTSLRLLGERGEAGVVEHGPQPAGGVGELSEDQQLALARPDVVRFEQPKEGLPTWPEWWT